MIVTVDISLSTLPAVVIVDALVIVHVTACPLTNWPLPAVHVLFVNALLFHARLVDPAVTVTSFLFIVYFAQLLVLLA